MPFKSISLQSVTLSNQRTAIAVPLVDKDLINLQKTAKLAEQSPADVIEWRADFLTDPTLQKIQQGLTILKSTLSKAIIFTWRSKSEGGQQILSQKDYLAFNQAAIQAGLAAIDVEYRLNKTIHHLLLTQASQKQVLVINSYHNFVSTEDTDHLLGLAMKMSKQGGDIIKIAVMANKMTDLHILHQASLAIDAKISQAIITISMGQLGFMSRIRASQNHSVMTFASLNQASAPGQIELKELKKQMALFN